jgi:hypothetical protein
MRALASLAVNERSVAHKHMQQAMRSIDEELPVTETAAHGIGRSRGLHVRADRMVFIGELLNTPGGQSQASALLSEMMQMLKEEVEVLTATPPALSQSSGEQVRPLRRRLALFSQLQLMLDNEQIGNAKAHAATLSTRLRDDAVSVSQYATQGVFVPNVMVSLPHFQPAEFVSTASHYATRWARGCALLVAAEKVAQVIQLIHHGTRRSLQEGVQLLVVMEESDMAHLFTVCRDVMRTTDLERHGPRGATVWWHQVDENGDSFAEMNTLAEWSATHDLRQARLLLMGRDGAANPKDGIVILDKLRANFLLYARDAC